MLKAHLPVADAGAAGEGKLFYYSAQNMGHGEVGQHIVPGAVVQVGLFAVRLHSHDCGEHVCVGQHNSFWIACIGPCASDSAGRFHVNLLTVACEAPFKMQLRDSFNLERAAVSKFLQ